MSNLNLHDIFIILMTDCIFWQQTLKPGERAPLNNEIGEGCIEVESANVFELNKEDENSIIRVFAYVHLPTEVPDSDNEQNDKEKEREPIQEEKVNKILFASIKPSQKETCELSYIVSPFDFIELENTSKSTITFNGVYRLLDDLEEEDYYDEEEEAHPEEEEKEAKPKSKSKKEAKEEEEQAEEINTDEIVSKVVNHLKAHQKNQK